jgi:predicted  nucleic acid-binding Zn-ribbon protein
MTNQHEHGHHHEDESHVFCKLKEIHEDVVNVRKDLEALSRKVDHKMSQLSDKITALNSGIDAAIARVQTDVTALNAKIVELQAKVDAGTATPEDLAALDSAQAKVDALDPTKPDTLPTP